MNLANETEIALNILPVVFVALSIWLGVARYAIDNSDKETDIDFYSTGIAIIGGYAILGYTLMQILDEISQSTNSSSIQGAIDGMRVFTILIGLILLYAVVDELEKYEVNLFGFVKALTAAFCLIAMLLASVHLFWPA